VGIGLGGFQLKGVAAMSSASEAHNAVIAELSPELDQLAIDAMADWKVPGAALGRGAGRQGGTREGLWSARHRREPPRHPSTQFLIGSITKTFTATAVARSLHNEERLDWTKPVARLHPGVFGSTMR